jgi:hypothetical protein
MKMDSGVGCRCQMRMDATVPSWLRKKEERKKKKGLLLYAYTVTQAVQDNCHKKAR